MNSLIGSYRDRFIFCKYINKGFVVRVKCKFFTIDKLMKLLKSMYNSQPLLFNMRVFLFGGVKDLEVKNTGFSLP
jgi:hypothetical protein